MEDERKAFEEWAIDHKFLTHKDKQVVIEGAPIYANPMTQGAWMAWCAALKGA